MEVKVKDIAEILQGRVEGDADLKIYAPGKIEDAAPGQITFLSNPKYENYIYTTEASAVLVKDDFVPKSEVQATLIYVEDVPTALITLMNSLGNNQTEEKCISDQTEISDELRKREDISIGAFTSIDPSAQIGKNAKIGAQVFIARGVIIGDHVSLHNGVKIYHDCIIGSHVTIQANTVIGSDGFGYVPDQNNVYQKVPQLGIVRIGDNVDIGSNVVIDRATMGETSIGNGVKLDNLIQIAHNVKIGENTVIAAQAGVAGSAEVGKNSMIGGQVGIVGHIKLGDGNKIQAQSGVTRNTEENTSWFGSPALEYRNYQKSYIHFKNLDELAARVKELEKKM